MDVCPSSRAHTRALPGLVVSSALICPSSVRYNPERQARTFNGELLRVAAAKFVGKKDFSCPLLDRVIKALNAKRGGCMKHEERISERRIFELGALNHNAAIRILILSMRNPAV